jgi:3'-phosphoadenosine 5'-phosphosulfate sulfotransferase (PAPS reductase)/FAD synthetase
MKRSKEELKMLQALPLEIKVAKTKLRIREWYEAWGGDVYVSFSGGKDSTVLLHIVREMYPDVEAFFANTGLEYPEIQQFVKTFDNVMIMRPKMRFDDVIRTCGYPIIGKQQSNTVRLAKKNIIDGKYTLRIMELGITPEEGMEMGLSLPSDEMLERYKKTRERSKFFHPQYKPLLNVDFDISEQCCNVMKKTPAHLFEKITGKKPIIATMASESMSRESAWLQSGCNAFDSNRPRSTPMSFWTEQDVLQYIKENNLPIASVYGEVVEENGRLRTTGESRTGCIFCAFGAHCEKGETRFERLKQTHPRQYEYCIGGGEYDEAGIWKPSKEGLGMGHVFDELNKIYGDGFIRY